MKRFCSVLVSLIMFVCVLSGNTHGVLAGDSYGIGVFTETFENPAAYGVTWKTYAGNPMQISGGKINGIDYNSVTRTAFLDTVTLSKNYVLSCDSLTQGSSIGNEGRILFNANANGTSYYEVVMQAGLSSANPKIILKKVISGTETTIAASTVNYASNSHTVRVNIYYELGGYITVDCSRMVTTSTGALATGYKTRIFDRVQDTSLLPGKVGFSSKSSNSAFDNLRIEEEGIAVLRRDITIPDGTMVNYLGTEKGKQVTVTTTFKSNMMDRVADGTFIAVLKDENENIMSIATKPFSLDRADVSTNSITCAVNLDIPSSATNAYKITGYYWSKNTMEPFNHQVLFSQ